jgi:hypothetical protein
MAASYILQFIHVCPPSEIKVPGLFFLSSGILR